MCRAGVAAIAGVVSMVGVVVTSASPAGASTSLSITTTSLPDATVTSPYSVTLQATGGTLPYTWSWNTVTFRNDPNAQLPPGLSLDPTSGTISGTPSEWGTFDFDVWLTDSESPPVTWGTAYTFNVQPLTPPTLTMTTTSVPNASLGTAYSTTLQATGGVPPIVWSIQSGSLPQGLSLSSSGTISGTPQLPQTSSFVVQVQDEGANGDNPDYASEQQTVTRQFSIDVGSGESAADPTLQQLGNFLVGADQNSNGLLGTVEGVVDSLLPDAEELAYLGCALENLTYLIPGVGGGPPPCAGLYP